MNEADWLSPEMTAQAMEIASLRRQLAEAKAEVGDWKECCLRLAELDYALDLLERIRQAPLDMYDKELAGEVKDFLAKRKDTK